MNIRDCAFTTNSHAVKNVNVRVVHNRWETIHCACAQPLVGLVGDCNFIPN
jgi:hypothetical protein